MVSGSKFSMFRFLRVVVILLTIGDLHIRPAYAIPFHEAVRLSKSGNSWHVNASVLVDEVINGFRSQLPDTMPLPEIYKSFTKKVLFFTVHGFCRFRNGKIRGLKSVHRTGPIGFKFNEKANTVQFHVNVGAKQLSASFQGHAELKPIRIDPSITATIPSFQISAKVCGKLSEPVEFRTCGIKLSVGQANLSFHKMGPLNGIVGAISNLVIRHMQPKLVADAQNALPKKADAFLKKITAHLVTQFKNILAKR